MRPVLLAVPMLMLLAASGSAQQINMPSRLPSPDQKGEIRVQVNMNFFVPGAVNNTEASLKAQEDARKALYASAGRECEVLKEVLASECRIESVNVNMSRNYGQPMNEGFTATGNFGFRVVLK